MTSFHELKRSGLAERSYSRYPRNDSPARIAGGVALAAILAMFGYGAGWISRADWGAAPNPAEMTSLPPSGRPLSQHPKS